MESEEKEKKAKKTDFNENIELWKYFNERMLKLKDVLLQILTWLLAFALVILGFMVQKEMVSFENELFKVKSENEYVVGFFSVLGILLCLYCFYLVYAYSKLINDNWYSAGYVRDKLDNLNKISPENEKMKKKREKFRNWAPFGEKIPFFINIHFLPSFCIKISMPVLVFLAIFIWILAKTVCC
jgi:hypothetical protein